MDRPFNWLLLFALISTATHTVRAQTGFQCFNCYSRVCGANTSELISLFDSSTFDCCECFTGDETCDSTAAAASLSQTYENRPLEECCDNVSRIVRTEFYTHSTGNDDDTCGQYNALCFHGVQDLLDNSQPVLELSAGVFIVLHFQFDISQTNCINSLLVRPYRGDDVSGLNFTIYKTFTSTVMGIRSRLFQEKKSFSVTLSGRDSSLLFLTPNLPVCGIDAGDTLGFSISDTADFRLGGIQGPSKMAIQNITGSVEEQQCEELNGLIEAPLIPVVKTLQGLDPLIAVELGAASTMLTTPSPATTAPSFTNGTDTLSSSLSPDTSTESTATATPAPAVLSIEVIIGIGAGGGACLVLLIVILIIVTCLCCVRGRRATFVVDRKSRLDSLSLRLENSRASQRMQELSPQRITVVNPEAEETNEYDVPTEQLHIYHMPTGGGWTNGGVQAGRLAATGQEMTNSFPESNPGVYSDPTELGTNPPIHYDVPTALIRAQGQTPPLPIYHELEGPTERVAQSGSTNNIYTETAFGLQDDVEPRDSMFGSNHSLRSSSVETNTTRDTMQTRDSTASDAPLMPHFYHELENSTAPRSRQYRSRSPVTSPLILTTSVSSASGITNSMDSGGHRVFEPGIYVPGGEERQHLAVIRDMDSSEEYRTWRQKSHKASKQKKQFFEESQTFWEPKDKEIEIFNQFSEKKFREILREQITFNNHLGAGQFGSVSKATWAISQGSSKKVAVKTLKPTMKKDGRIVFLKEAAIMGQFSHSNVVQLYGVVTVGEPIMIVMELLALGDLDSYLYNNYRPGEMLPPHKKTLLSFSRQVACGMKYLERKNFVHRDLAARNVLVNETLVCKIADFGMSRNLSESTYYTSKGGTVPIKWTAPEGLNYKRFSIASDVYSYGMVLYEIWSLGLKPLADVKIQNVSEFVTSGRCQAPPPGCPRKIYEIMVHCWSPEACDRPSFSTIFEILNGSDTELLSWSEDDMAQISNLAVQLGAPLSEAKNMFPGLQNRNLVEEREAEFLSTAV